MRVKNSYIITPKLLKGYLFVSSWKSNSFTRDNCFLMHAQKMERNLQCGFCTHFLAWTKLPSLLVSLFFARCLVVIGCTVFIEPGGYGSPSCVFPANGTAFTVLIFIWVCSRVCLCSGRNAVSLFEWPCLRWFWVKWNLHGGGCICLPPSRSFNLTGGTDNTSATSRSKGPVTLPS